jgi:hypothetical protein
MIRCLSCSPQDQLSSSPVLITYSPLLQGDQHSQGMEGKEVNTEKEVGDDEDEAGNESGRKGPRPADAEVTPALMSLGMQLIT